MRLRTKVFQLTLLTVIPTLVLACVLAFVLVDREREIQRAGAFDRNRAFMTAVDVEIRGQQLSLQGLATSPNIAPGTLRAFREEMIRFLASQRDWRSVSL